MFIDMTYMLQPEFQNDTIPYKVYYVIASMHVYITTLFVGFMFSECNSIASGHGYTVTTTKETVENYNSIRQIDVISFETCTSGLGATQSWNMQTHHFLKYYVSLRLKDRTLPRN